MNGTFTCSRCGLEKPAIQRPIRSPYKAPVCKSCEPDERAERTKRLDQGRRR